MNTVYHFYRGDRTVAQAAGRRPVTAEDQHQNQASRFANYPGHSGTVIVFVRTLRISLAIFFLRMPHTLSFINQGLYITLATDSVF
jgi:transposase